MMLKNLRHRLSFLSSRRSRILVFLIVVFLVFFELWLWSKDGITPDIKIVRKDTLLSLYFDSYPVGRAHIENDTFPTSVQVSVSPSDLPRKYFNSTNASKTYKLPHSLSWSLDMPVNNPFSFRLLFQGDQIFTFYGNPYRHLNSGWEDPEQMLKKAESQRVQISLYNGLKWIAWLLMKPFLFVASLLSVLYLLVSISKKSYAPTKEPEISPRKYLLLVVLVTTMGVLSFLLSRYLMKTYTEEVPHVPDAVSYIIQSKILSSGNFVIPFKDIPDFLSQSKYNEYFYHWYHVHSSYLTVDYMLGHPLILSIGNIFNSLRLIPPLVGALCIMLVALSIFVITKSFFFSALGSVLLLASPFFQTQTIDYMSHNTAALYVLLSIFPIFLRRPKFYFTSGFFIGLLLQTRPLTFIPLITICIMYEVISAITDKDISQLINKVLFFILGLALPLILLFHYNYISTGSMLMTPYSYHGILNKVGLGSDFKASYGLLNGFSNVVVFSFYYLKNFYISFGPFLLSFIFLPWYKNRTRDVILIQALCSGIVGIWFFFDANAFMYGPRFIYEVTPIICILYGVVFYYVHKVLSSTKITKFIFYLFLFFFFYQIALFDMGWFGKIKPEYEGIAFVPSSVMELKGFNFSDARFKKISEKYKNEKKIFLMESKSNWWEFSGAWLNDYPLNKSKHIFISEPSNFAEGLSNSIVLDWNQLGK